jgi:transposase
MLLRLSVEERASVEEASRGARRVLEWRRLRALLLADGGMTRAEAAAALGCSERSVGNWVAAWKASGEAGLADRRTSHKPRALDAPGEAALEALLLESPQERGLSSAGWTVGLLSQALAVQGRRVAPRTLRTVLKRLGYRWRRPKYVLGRPDPAYEEKRGR